MRSNSFLIVFVFSLCILSLGCKKYVRVNSLTDQLFANQVFANEATANNAMGGMYRTLRDKLYNGGSYSPAILSGLSSDELYTYFPNPDFNDYYNNSIKVTNNSLPWPYLYQIIYTANAAIEGLQQNNNIPVAGVQQFLGEAKFIRAFCYFYLVNFFGDVPLITGTDVNINASASRTPSADIYTQMIKDLTDAQSALGTDYAFSNGEHIRANKWTATALLARIYLYQQDWTGASAQASSVINSGDYSLLSDIDSFGIQNNREAIFQYANNETDLNTEATYFIFSSSPSLLCTGYLLNAFEPGDQRATKWIQSGSYLGDLFAYPFKYKSTSAGSNEYFTILRLAEQYLIRAESRAAQHDIPGAIADVNIIRERAGLSDLPSNLTESECQQAIFHERQVEFFAEGHRWFDLKRTGQINQILGTEKASWKPQAALFPIPLSDIQKDAHLTQNDGY